jgi:hypothetical protein
MECKQPLLELNNWPRFYPFKLKFVHTFTQGPVVKNLLCPYFTNVRDMLACSSLAGLSCLV